MRTCGTGSGSGCVSRTWGYIHFNAILIGTNTVRSVDLYYIHGRWWHPDMGLFLSPNEEGDYLFGGDGPPRQDPANDAWIVNAFVDFGKGGPTERAFVLTMGEFVQGSVTAAHQAFYPPANWTWQDRFGNAIRVYAPVVVAQGIFVVLPQATLRGVPYLGRTLLGRLMTTLGAACAADEQDCVNAASNSAQSVWRLDPFQRGVEIENILGRSPQLVQNFPVIDRFEGGVATSIKSIDLSAPSYQNISTLTREVEGYVTSLAEGAGCKVGGFTIQAYQITGRQLILAIPPGFTGPQSTALQQLQQWASTQGVTLSIAVVP